MKLAHGMPLPPWPTVPTPHTKLASQDGQPKSVALSKPNTPPMPPLPVPATQADIHAQGTSTPSDAQPLPFAPQPPAVSPCGSSEPLEARSKVLRGPRKPKDDMLTRQINAHCSERHYAKIDAAAKIAGRKLGRYLLRCALETSERVCDEARLYREIVQRGAEEGPRKS